MCLYLLLLCTHPLSLLFGDKKATTLKEPLSLTLPKAAKWTLSHLLEKKITPKGVGSGPDPTLVLQNFMDFSCQKMIKELKF